jgi:hypothetical protein
MALLTLVAFSSDMLFAAFLQTRHAGAKVRMRRRDTFGAFPYRFETIEHRFDRIDPDTGVSFFGSSESPILASSTKNTRVSS